MYDPGKKAGQMKMIREPHGVVAYTWVEDGNNSHWEKVGDVLGGTDKDNAGKTMFEGKVRSCSSFVPVLAVFCACRRMITYFLLTWKMVNLL